MQQNVFVIAEGVGLYIVQLLTVAVTLVSLGLIASCPALAAAMDAHDWPNG